MLIGSVDSVIVFDSSDVEIVLTVARLTLAESVSWVAFVTNSVVVFLVIGLIVVNMMFVETLLFLLELFLVVLDVAGLVVVSKDVKKV